MDSIHSGLWANRMGVVKRVLCFEAVRGNKFQISLARPKVPFDTKFNSDRLLARIDGFEVKRTAIGRLRGHGDQFAAIAFK